MDMFEMEKPSSVFDLIDMVCEISEDYVKGMTHIPAQEAGLDRRCGYIYIDDDCIAVRWGNPNRNIRYYGGFEYVDPEFVKEMGDYVFYTADQNSDEDDPCRITRAINAWKRGPGSDYQVGSD